MIRKIGESMNMFKKKQVREESDPVPGAFFKNRDGAREGHQAGWISPVYSHSGTCHIDPGTVEKNRCLSWRSGTPESEAFRVLRTRVLQRTREAGHNTIMVTSALPGEGKTLAAINLALTLAREFQNTVMLVDCNLKKQSIHKYLGFAGEKGLMDYIAGGRALSELITWPGIEKMTVISGGAPCEETSEMLGSPVMRELVSEMKERYSDRYIIFDFPDALSSADVLTFAPLVDQVIVVVRAGKTSLEDVARALRLIPEEKVLGFVLNRCEKS